ncbi:MAG: hypothetical protein KME16_00130 [Scytolyngbya sp. HA4215-MV1]|jgi:hypothetical protein|nr:hypothetical protein [Scytolyngbya sp. HA4215-MV1]
MQKTLKRAIAGVSFGALILSALPAFAAPYRDSENNIFITGLSAQQEVLLTYPGTPRTGSARANACGAVTVRGTNGVPLSGTIKVDGTSIDTTTLSQQLLPPCSNGSFSEPRPNNFRTYDGSVIVVGKTPNNYYAIETQEDGTRKVRANACGFALIKPNARFNHLPTTQVGINGAAPAEISTLTQKGAPICRNGIVYYPADWLSGS